MLRFLGRPIRIVLRWQFAASVVGALIGGLLAGRHGAVSALAGGLVSIVAGLASAWLASQSATKSAGGILLGALRAEVLKIGLAVLLLWLVLANYDGVVAGALIASFAVTMIVFSMAFFVRDY